MSHPIINTARSYIGTKYAHKGRIPHVVLDCLGLLVCAGKENGYHIDEVDDYYPGFINGKLLVRRFEEHLEYETRTDVDRIALMGYKGKLPTHVMFVTAEGTCIQCLEGRNRGVIETAYTSIWKNRTTHCFQLPEL